MEIDTSTRLIIAGLTFAIFAIFESLFPHRAAYTQKFKRWTANLGLFLVDLLLVGIPLGAVAFGFILFAQFANERIGECAFARAGGAGNANDKGFACVLKKLFDSGTSLRFFVFEIPD